MLTLILLPGMDGSSFLFAEFAAQFQVGFSVKCISYSPTIPLTYSELVEETCSQIPDTGELVILGESFSGPIAVMLAHRYATRVVALILCCTFVRNPRPLFSTCQFMTKFASLKFVPKNIMRFLLFGRFGSQKRYAALDRALSPLTTRVFQARLAAVLAIDVSLQLSELTMPILYLQATQDDLVPKGAFREILKHRKHANLVTFRAPHCLLQVLPVESARVVKQFMKDIGY